MKVEMKALKAATEAVRAALGRGAHASDIAEAVLLALPAPATGGEAVDTPNTVGSAIENLVEAVRTHCWKLAAGQSFDKDRENVDRAKAELLRAVTAFTAPNGEAVAWDGNTGVKDKDGEPLYLGDRVRYCIESRHTEEAYWNPEYEIVWKAPSFTLKHVGGGKDGGSHDFILRCGGSNGDLQLLQRGALYTAAPSPKGEAVAYVDPSDLEWVRRTPGNQSVLIRKEPTHSMTTALYTAPPSPKAEAEQSFWAIELGAAQGVSPPKYWAAIQRGWTSNIHEASQFHTKQAAEEEKISANLTAIVTQHAWIGRPKGEAEQSAIAAATKALYALYPAQGLEADLDNWYPNCPGKVACDIPWEGLTEVRRSKVCRDAKAVIDAYESAKAEPEQEAVAELMAALEGILPNGSADGRHIQALHAGISRRDWVAVEVAANNIRDKAQTAIRARGHRAPEVK